MAGRFQRAREEGRQEGRQEGREEVRQEATRTFLERLLRRRFGPLSPRVAERLRGASVGDLETWADQFVDANTLDDVFETRRPEAPNLTEGDSP